MFLVQVNKNIARVTEKELVTSGSQNCYVMEFQFSSEWDYLERTVVFTRSVVDGVPPARDTVFQQYLTSENTCMIPWEIMVDPKKELFVGVYGTRDGNVVLPTVWASIGTTLMGVTTGMEMSPPTANVYEGLLNELSKIRTNLDHLVIGTMLRVFSDQNITTVDDFLNAGLPRSFALVNTTITPYVTLRSNDPILSLPFISEMVYIEDSAMEGHTDYRQLKLTNMLGHTYLIQYDAVNTPHTIVGIIRQEDTVATTFFWMTATMETEPTLDQEVSVSKDRFNDVPNVGDAVYGFIRNSGTEKFVKYVEGIVESVDDISVTLRLDEIDDMTPGAGPEGKPGKDGAQGEKGDKGDDGITPHIDDETKHWFIGDTDTGVLAEGVGGSADYWYGIQNYGCGLDKTPDAQGYFGTQIVETDASLNIADFPDGAVGYLITGDNNVTGDNTSKGVYLLTCEKGPHDVDFGGYLCPVKEYRKIVALPSDGDKVLSPAMLFINFDSNPPKKNTQYIGGPDNFIGNLPSKGHTYQCKGFWICGNELYALELTVHAPNSGSTDYRCQIQVITKIGAESTASESYSVKTPVGTIVAWSGTIADIPTGWQLCDGTNGTPDLRGRFIFGAAEESDVWNSGGEKTHTLSVDEMPSHKHSIGYVTNSVSNQGNTGNNTAPYAVSGQVDGKAIPNWYYYNSPYSKYDAHVSTAGSTEPHNNMPPYFTLAYIMKMTQDETDAPFTLGDTLSLDIDDVLNVKDPVNNVVTTEEYEALTEEQKASGLWLINDPDEPPKEPDTPVTPPSTAITDSVPTGSVIMWSGAIADIPEGWVLCDGQNDTPDLRNKFVLGYGTRVVGSVGGYESVILTKEQMPQHQHEVSIVSGSTTFRAETATAGGTVAAPYAPRIISSTLVGSNQPHSNMPPYYVLAYIMKISKTLDGVVSVEDYDVPRTKGSWHIRKYSDGYIEMDYFNGELLWTGCRETYSGSKMWTPTNYTGMFSYPVTLVQRYSETASICYFGTETITTAFRNSTVVELDRTAMYSPIVQRDTPPPWTDTEGSISIHVTGRWK